LDVDITGYNFIKLVVKMDSNSVNHYSCAVAWGDACVYSTHVHDWGEGKVTTTPTCDNEGVMTYTCSCGETKTEAVSATGHDWADATCTAPQTCKNCGATQGEKLPHTPAAAVKENEVAATCKAEGSYDLVVKCSVCGTEISRETKTIEKLPHTEVVDAAKAPTCTETGLTEGKHCSACGEVLVAQEVVKELGHSYGEGVVTKAATPFETGVMTYTCSACSDTKTADIPALTFSSAISGKSLILDGEIIIKLYVYFEGDLFPEKIAYNTVLQNGGVLVWEGSDYPGSVEQAVKGTETYSVGVNAGSIYAGHYEYTTKSEGIAAKEYADTIYLIPYMEIDGKYLYGELMEYSVQTYCESKIENPGKEGQALVETCVALLNYGAAAQLERKYETNKLANRNLPEFLARGKITEAMMNPTWDDSYLIALKEPSAEMLSVFTEKKTDSWNAPSKSLVLDGAINAKFYFGVKNEYVTAFQNAESRKMYFWTEDTYNELVAAGQPLTTENATYSKETTFTKVSEKYGYEVSASSDPIVAKKWGQTLYVAVVCIDSEGNEHYSDIVVYSPLEYAKSKISGTSSAEALKDLCKALAIYCNRAKAYFGK
jgi:hypothetical protein